MRSSPESPSSAPAPDAPRPRGKYGRKAPAVSEPEPKPGVRESGSEPDAAATHVYDTLAGTIVSAHGVQGTLKVKPATDTAISLFVPTGSKKVPIWIGPSSEVGAVYQIVSAKRQEPKNIYLVHVETVHDRTTAETLIGRSLFAPGARRVPLAEAEYFVSDLIGLEIVDEQGVSLGKLVDVHRSPAHDIYETDQDVLIPAVTEYVARVDLAGGKLVVHDAERLRMTETIGSAATEPED